MRTSAIASATDDNTSATETAPSLGAVGCGSATCAAGIGVVDDLLDEKEAAALLRLSVRTARLRRYEGDSPAFIRMGRHVYFRRSTVLSWLYAQEQAAVAE